MEVGKNYNGFKLVSQENIDEIKSIGRVFEHEKSGARLFQLENDDDNKVFSISFRTPPEDSTGVPHILEHSVLCGSRKFPVKEPFVDLAKSSLNTFLNAMTFSDKTMYPVASRNEKDFFNLMDVYMDAVLYPNIYKYPEIFMQEGWHYELENKKDNINYKGVVYNEMKGEFSSPESILFRKVEESLYPDTPYSFESGGDPDVIPDLSIDEFLSFHKKYYHPSNSYIFLYGNGDISKELKFLNDNYLKNFDRIKIDSEIPFQKPFKSMKEMSVPYPLSSDESAADKTYLNMNFSVGKSTDPLIYLSFEILEYMLLETPAAPLKKALIDAGIGKDVLGRFDNSILQPVFSIVVKNSNEDKKDEFKRIVFDTLKGLVEKGLDKELIEASINIKEFELREADFRSYPKGLIYNIKSMDSWLYGEDPRIHLRFEPQLSQIKKALTSDYFEKLIEKYILNNTHSSFIVLKPEKGLTESRNRETEIKLERYKQGLSDRDLDKIIENTKKLQKRQTSPDSPEAVATMPNLSLDDIDPKVEKLPIVENDEAGVKVLFHPVFTGGIGYLNLYFDASPVPKELIPYEGLLAEVLGKEDTSKYDYAGLSNAVNIHTGGIEFNVETYIENGSNTKFHPKFVVRSKSLIDKLPKVMELIGEITRSTKFDDKRRLLEIIREVKSRFELMIFDRGHLVTAKRMSSYFSPSGMYNEITSGISFYKFISDLEKHFDDVYEKVISNLKRVSDMVFNRTNLLVSFTASKGDYEKLKSIIGDLLGKFGNSRLNPGAFDFEIDPENEGLMTQGRVQYSAKGYNFIELGYSYTGCLQVLQTILGYDYLWNMIRVQGGAYGAFASFGRGGNVYLSSYRDPNLKRTLDVFDNVGDYLEKFNAGKEEMTKYIIGTMSRLDFPMTPSMKGERATINYISHITTEDMQSERDDVLSCSAHDINKLSDMLKDVVKQNFLCVLGNEKNIKDNKQIFNNLINVFE